MLPYFIEMPHLITAEEIAELEGMIEHSDFISYDTISGKKDGNLCWDMNIEKFNRFELKSYTFFVHQEPHTSVVEHTDNPKWKRNTTLIVPLFWSDDYAPCKFVHGFVDGPSVCTPTPYLFNTQKPHYINNNHKARYNFQICFEEEIEDVYRRL